MAGEEKQIVVEETTVVPGKMEFRLISPTESNFLKHIEWNKEELLAAVRSKVALYEGIVYTEETVKTAKNDRAELNNLVIFDSDYKENLKPENEEESEKEEPKGIPQLPGPSEVEDEDVIDAEYTETEIDQETDEEPEEDITDEILGDAEEPDDMDGYDYEDPEDEV